MVRVVDISNTSRLSSVSERESNATADSAISPAQRADNTAQAIHNSNMEGMEVSQPVVQETYDYIAGKISATTLVDRVKALHGLD